MPRTAGFSCTIHLVLNGVMGVPLKSYGPLSIASAAISGLNLDGRRRLSVRFVCSNNISQSWRGKLGSNPQRTETKWVFYGLMASSAEFSLCR